MAHLVVPPVRFVVDWNLVPNFNFLIFLSPVWLICLLKGALHTCSDVQRQRHRPHGHSSNKHESSSYYSSSNVSTRTNVSHRAQSYYARVNARCVRCRLAFVLRPCKRSLFTTSLCARFTIVFTPSPRVRSSHVRITSRPYYVVIRSATGPRS